MKFTAHLSQKVIRVYTVLKSITHVHTYYLLVITIQYILYLNIILSGAFLIFWDSSYDYGGLSEELLSYNDCLRQVLLQRSQVEN